MPHEVDLDVFVAAEKAKDSTVIRAGDREFVIPPPVLWPNEALQSALLDRDKCAKLLLGDEQWDAFQAAGGTGALLVKIIEEREQLPVGESEAS